MISEEKIDLLFSNNEIVLQEAVIGDAPPLDQFDTALHEETLFRRIKLFFHTIDKVRYLHHTKLKLTDAKENEIKFSAVGLVAVEYNNATFASKLISKEINSGDGKLSLVILAPISAVQYMGYLFKSLVSRWTPERLPESVGYIRSSALKIESGRPLSVLIDSYIKQETPIQLKIQAKALALSVGEKFWENQSQETNGKDSIKIDHLPRDEESAGYLSKAIPFFSHASQEQYVSLFTNLREESRISATFVILLILSTMIATFGLFHQLHFRYHRGNASRTVDAAYCKFEYGCAAAGLCVGISSCKDHSCRCCHSDSDFCTDRMVHTYRETYF